MWSRAQLKEKAKAAFNRNYWKVVLVSAIVALLGGAGASSSFSTNFSQNYEIGSDYGSSYEEGYYDDYYYENEPVIEGDFFQEIEDFFNSQEGQDMLLGMLVIFIIVFLVVFVIAMAVALVLQAFIYNPLEVGTKRFFFKNLNEKANVREVTHAYDHDYKNVVKTLFFRDLYTMLWSLLFIIPGIVKSYEYKMMPYLLAENPSMPKEQAFALSKKMMDGQKWKAFVLDLSFIGWEILSGFTLGLLGIFYVAPYKNMTHAALYECLCYQRQWTNASYVQPQNSQVVNAAETADMTDTTEENEIE